MGWVRVSPRGHTVSQGSAGGPLARSTGSPGSPATSQRGQCTAGPAGHNHGPVSRVRARSHQPADSIPPEDHLHLLLPVLIGPRTRSKLWKGWCPRPRAMWFSLINPHSSFYSSAHSTSPPASSPSRLFPRLTHSRPPILSGKVGVLPKGRGGGVSYTEFVGPATLCDAACTSLRTQNHMQTALWYRIGCNISVYMCAYT